MDKSEMIASRLRQAREWAGLSQGQVAKMLGIHRPTVSEMEAGRRKVSAEELAELAKIYKVRMEWLAYAEDETQDEYRDRVELAARELSKMKPEDLDSLLELLSALRNQSEDEG